MKRKITVAILVCFVLVMLSGCEREYQMEYDFGVIFTTEYKNYSQIKYFNEEMQEISTLSYHYPNISYDGFRNSLIVGNELYLLPKGHADKLDYGKVISLNLADGKIKEYNFRRANITDFECALNLLCISSNLNSINYIDVYDLQTEKIQTMEVENAFINNLLVEGNRIYGTMTDLETDHCFLCEFNIVRGTYEVMHEIQAEPDFMEFYQGNLYFSNEDILYEYNIKSKTMAEIMIPHKNAYNLNLVEDMLYIGCTDILNGTESYVDVMCLPEKKIVKSIKHEGAILQLEVSEEDELYILDYDNLSVYDVSTKEPTLINSMVLQTDKEYYIGGFYLNEINK